MEIEKKSVIKDPLATESIGKLMGKFAVPAIISNIVAALYNIVDQIFIGQKLGTLGNAATNVVFPLVMIMITFAMMFGVGGSSNLSLLLGQGDNEKAGKVTGNSITLMVIFGLLISIVSFIFLKPLMILFGGADTVLSYSVEYAGILLIGCPFYIIGVGGSQLIRADGSPGLSMFCTLIGAVLNIILDPIFIFGFDMGMTGAALATIIGQFVSAMIVLWYLGRFKSVKLHKEHFKLGKDTMLPIFSLGLASGLQQIGTTCYQIVLNNTLVHYGAQSIYGRDIPLACVGIISKVNVMFSSIIMGISQSCQPIFGFNFGAGNYRRVKKTFKVAIMAVSFVSAAAFLCYQIFPRKLIRIFGDGSDLYFEFAIKYFRIFMALVVIGSIQILVSNFFSSIGKGRLGIVTSMSRQIFFLLPLIVIFPLFFGIDGVLYAGPIADGAAGILAITLVIRETKKWPVSIL
ncbi:MAG: MATE family efflux transporter [Lachnospiraceae bacterium]